MNRDQDLSLKLRFKRVLFQIGYYSPINVELSQYTGPEPKRELLTDLDVLGLKFDPVLTPHRVVCDCKSGKTTSKSGKKVSDPNRLFWLRGVSDYFGANVAYYLRPIIGSHARAIAPKLGVRTVDEKDLQSIEKELKVDSLPLPIHDMDFYEQKQALWGIAVPSGGKPTAQQLELKKVYTYLSYEYWYIDQHRNLLRLVAHFQEIAHLLSPMDRRDVLLAYAGLERFTHCLLEMGNVIYAFGVSDIPRNIRIYLFGGPLALRDREQFFELLNELTGLSESLDPPFLGDILELTNRIINNPYESAEILRYLEATHGWCVQLGNKDLAPVFGGSLLTGAIVLARDVAITFAKVTGMREEIFSHLLSL